ncbi:DUF3151 domain-containing protein [Virgisporangium ochraceum]|uniref:DUF3151 domain-containing protein n=1 Tax=Virgisporangium ochraceum TaxID=65505 RepID=A0A8J3ZRC7_9ACTN|nr:DUF3151 domain-containing protein [Virgisporangium ochraceum]GIJ66126.1 hypothetical protein Voc01_010430 [Virgisporangium ochraceum]
MQNLLPDVPPTLLPENAAAAAALEKALASPEDIAALKAVAADNPTYSAAWGRLAEWAYGEGDQVTAYAFARTGYHRGLDQLRRNGWRGHGPVPWSHPANQGFLRCLNVLALAAAAIGEADEAARCAQFLRDSDPSAADALTG